MKKKERTMQYLSKKWFIIKIEKNEIFEKK